MNTEKQKEIIRHFDQSTILVVGDLMLDRYLHGTMTRISPDAPAPLIEISSENFRLGGAANAINTVCEMGGEVLAAGVVGDDWFVRRLIHLLNQKNVDTSGLIESKERPTTVKTRVIASHQYILRLDRENREKIPPESTRHILEFINANIDKIDAVLLSDYDKGVVSQMLIDGVLRATGTAAKPVIVFPKITNFFNYNGVSLVITDLEKASSLTGIRQINETSIRNMGQWMLTHLECDHILITQGNDMMSLFVKNGKVTHMSARSGELHNITGNIDTIASVIALCLASGISTLDDAVQMAIIAAQVVPENAECTFLTREQLMQTLDSMTP